jgi:hypothetical protein
MTAIISYEDEVTLREYTLELHLVLDLLYLETHSPEEERRPTHSREPDTHMPLEYEHAK